MGPFSLSPIERGGRGGSNDKGNVPLSLLVEVTATLAGRDPEKGIGIERHQVPLASVTPSKQFHIEFVLGRATRNSRQILSKIFVIKC